MNYNNIYIINDNNNLFGIDDEKMKDINIKKNLISTTINNKNNSVYHIYLID